MTLDSIDRWEFFEKGATWYQLSNTNNYLAIKTGDPTYGVEIYDFNTKQLIHKLPINGPSLTGIEFSPDDKYIVTSNGLTNRSLKTWDLTTGTAVYEIKDGGYESISISHSGKFIITTIGRYLLLYPLKTSTSIQLNINNSEFLLYPNPTNGEVKINIEKSGIVNIYDNKGNLHKVIESLPIENGINFNVSDLPNGEYFIFLEGKKTNTYKLIINK